MSPSLIALMAGAACFAAHAMLSLILLRVPGRASPAARHAASAGFTHLIGTIIAAMAFEPLPYWPIAAASGFGAIVWLFAYSAVYKSVSLRILTQLAHTKGNSLSLDEVSSQFVRPEFTARIGVLLAMGCIHCDGNSYRLTRKGQLIARRIRLVQRLCGIERSGLYGG